MESKKLVVGGIVLAVIGVAVYLYTRPPQATNVRLPDEAPRTPASQTAADAGSVLDALSRVAERGAAIYQSVRAQNATLDRQRAEDAQRAAASAAANRTGVFDRSGTDSTGGKGTK